MSTEIAPAPGYPEGLSRWFWPALVVGGVVMAVGVRGLIVNRAAVMATNPPGWLLVWVGANVVHDLLLVPAVLLAGVAARRFVPAPIRAVVQGGLLCSAIVVLYALPLVVGLGSSAGNETILPRDYGRGLLIVVAVIASVTLVVAIARTTCARGRRGITKARVNRGRTLRWARRRGGGRRPGGPAPGAGP